MTVQCPFCHSEHTELHIKLKDYFLSQEEFEILKCRQCGLLFTSPRPSDSELGRYYKSDEYLSHNENKKGLIPFIYNRVKRVNIANKFKIATSGISAKRLLDFGCGVGDFVSYAQQHGLEVCATDVSADARDAAAKKLGFSLPSPEDVLEMPDGSFDIITMWHVLEHISNLEKQVFHLNRLLAPGGHLILALPNYLSHDALHYQDKWAAYDVPRHLNHFDKNSLQNIFVQTPLRITRIEPLKWDAYYISMLSEKYKGSKCSFIKGVIEGFKSNRAAKRNGQYSSLVYILEREKI